MLELQLLELLLHHRLVGEALQEEGLVLGEGLLLLRDEVPRLLLLSLLREVREAGLDLGLLGLEIRGPLDLEAPHLLGVLQPDVGVLEVLLRHRHEDGRRAPVLYVASFRRRRRPRRDQAADLAPGLQEAHG